MSICFSIKEKVLLLAINGYSILASTSYQIANEHKAKQEDGCQKSNRRKVYWATND